MIYHNNFPEWGIWENIPEFLKHVKNSFIIILKLIVQPRHHVFHHHIPNSKVHGANMGPTWGLSAPDGPHFGPMKLAIRDLYKHYVSMHLRAICDAEVVAK